MIQMREVMEVGSLSDKSRATARGLPPKGESYEGSAWALEDSEMVQQDNKLLEQHMIKVGAGGQEDGVGGIWGRRLTGPSGGRGPLGVGVVRLAAVRGCAVHPSAAGADLGPGQSRRSAVACCALGAPPW
jgi:hypothetical protein